MKMNVHFETKTKLCELQKRDQTADLSGYLKISIYNFSQGVGKAISPNKRRDQCKGSF